MMKTFAILSGLLLITTVCIGQQVLPGRFTPAPADISPTTAAQNSQSISAKIGAEYHSVASFKARLERKPGDRNARVWRITMPDAWTLVDSRTGIVILYENAKRQDDRYRSRGRTGEKFTTIESVAKAHLRTIASKLGIPTEVKITGYKMVGDGVGQDSNPMGYFGCVFKNDSGQIVATLACDIQDGVVLEYTRSRSR